VSQETADLLIAAGKHRWLKRRRETVVAKRKGKVQTDWLVTSSSRPNSHFSASDSIHAAKMNKLSKCERESQGLRRTERYETSFE
jgi:hypothetical protein